MDDERYGTLRHTSSTVGKNNYFVNFNAQMEILVLVDTNDGKRTNFDMEFDTHLWILIDAQMHIAFLDRSSCSELSNSVIKLLIHVFGQRVGNFNVISCNYIVDSFSRHGERGKTRVEVQRRIWCECSSTG